MSLLMAQSGHHDRADPCPLLGVKRTSALDAKADVPQVHFGFDARDGFFNAASCAFAALRLSGIFFAINRRNMRRILVEIRSTDPKFFFVRVDPLPQDFAPRASLRARLALHAHKIGRKPVAVATAATPAMV